MMKLAIIGNETRAFSLSPFVSMGQKRSQEESSHQGTTLASTLIVDVWVSRTVKNKCVLF
jgi:hypothetical protein